MCSDFQGMIVNFIPSGALVAVAARSPAGILPVAFDDVFVNKL